MICIISGTNRENSFTYSIAEHIYHELKRIDGVDCMLLDLCLLNGQMVVQAPMYYQKHQDDIVRIIQEEYIIPADKFIFVVPEYNGSISGILKFFIDAISVRRYKENFGGKEALLVGVSSGRAGNLRGLDHLTGILQYLDVIVAPYKIPISIITKIYDIESGKFIDKDTKEMLNGQIQRFASDIITRY